MQRVPISMIIFLYSILILFAQLATARGGRRGGKGKGKSNLQFAQVAEFSLVQTQLADNKVIIPVSLRAFN